MKIGLIIYGSLDTLSGGYYYDRRLVQYLRDQREQVQIIPLPWRSYPRHLVDNLHFRLPAGLDVLIQDELNHPSLIRANQQKRAFPVISLVHHLRCSEDHPRPMRRVYEQVEKAYLRSVDGFIFNSHTTREVVQNLTGTRLPQLVAYPPTDRFGQAVTPSQVQTRSQQAGPLRVVFVGNVIPRKGLHTLLHALAQATSRPVLDVIGSLEADPACATAMRGLAQRLALQDRVTFHGKLHDEALAGLLANAHLLVVPSSYEGFGIVYLEGMSFGLPAIGTTAGAAPEIIAEGRNGFLTRPGDERTLAHRLDALHEDRALLNRLSLAALERYAQQPTWQQTAAGIHQFLHTMRENHKT